MTVDPRSGAFDRETIAPYVRCGLCGVRQDCPAEKAQHIRRQHSAKVWAEGALWRWERP